jgi:hypothetical protein
MHLSEHIWLGRSCHLDWIGWARHVGEGPTHAAGSVRAVNSFRSFLPGLKKRHDPSSPSASSFAGVHTIEMALC